MKQIPDYRLPLPTPAQAKNLAAGIEAAISPPIPTALTELAKANASGNHVTMEAASDSVIGRFTRAGEADTYFEADDDDPTLSFPIPVPESNARYASGDRFTIYDSYFEVSRLPDDAPKERAIEALTVAVAVVLKDAAKAESEMSGVTPIEFGILRQALAVVIEVLSEIQTNTE